MTISVIILAYKAEQWVAKCLDNLARQTYKNLEVVFVYDESGDRTGEIAASYPDVKVIRLERAGVSVSRNVGLATATGDYVHFFDVDDSISDNFYALMAEAVERYDADIAACEVINEPKPARNTPIVEAQVLITVPEKMRGTQVGRWGYVWRYLFRRSFLEEHGLQFEPGRMIEDLPFSLQAVYYANRVAMVPGAVYTYMLHEDSAMTTRNPQVRRRRHRDLIHMRKVRHRFARQHGFHIPGIPTSWGFLSLWYVKWLT